MSTYQVGYGLIDRYRISAFDIFKHLVAEQRAADVAEVSEEDCAILIGESIKYAYYFAKYASQEATYEDNLPTELMVGTTDSTTYEIGVSSTDSTGGKIVVAASSFVTKQLLENGEISYMVAENSTPTIHLMAGPGFYADMITISMVGLTAGNNPELRGYVNRDNRSIGFSFNLDAISGPGSIEIEFKPIDPSVDVTDFYQTLPLHP